MGSRMWKDQETVSWMGGGEGEMQGLFRLRGWRWPSPVGCWGDAFVGGSIFAVTWQESYWELLAGY